MFMPDPIGSTQSTSDCGCWDVDRSKFAYCVDRSEPKVNKGWILDEDSVTPKIHLTAQVDLNAGFICGFKTN